MKCFNCLTLCLYRYLYVCTFLFIIICVSYTCRHPLSIVGAGVVTCSNRYIEEKEKEKKKKKKKTKRQQQQNKTKTKKEEKKELVSHLESLATKHIFCRDKTMLAAKNFYADKKSSSR